MGLKSLRRSRYGLLRRVAALHSGLRPRSGLVLIGNRLWAAVFFGLVLLLVAQQ